MGNYPRFVLEHLDVKTRSGMEWQCLCPYHEDSSPSFSINVRKGLFICYACGAKGNMEDLARHLNASTPTKSTSIDDLEQQLEDYHRQRNLKVKKPVTGDFWTSRYRVDPSWLSKWSERIPNISSESLDRFCLGYDAIRNELVIPIFDFQGSAESCVRRRLGNFDGPKYLYSKGFKTSHHVFGAWQVRTRSWVRRPGRIAIVEGSIDALSMWQAGLPAVAILGSNLSTVQERILRRLDAQEYVIMTDRDHAGRKAHMEIEMALSNSGSILLEPSEWERGCKDVAEMTPHGRITAFSTATPIHKI